MGKRKYHHHNLKYISLICCILLFAVSMLSACSSGSTPETIPEIAEEVETEEETEESIVENDTDDIDEAASESLEDNIAEEDAEKEEEANAEDAVLLEETEEETEESSEEETEEETEEEIVYTYTDVSKTVYASRALNVRSGPSVKFDVIGSYASNGAITVTGQCNETGWYRVSYKGGVGYVSSKYTMAEKRVVETQAETQAAEQETAAETQAEETQAAETQAAEQVQQQSSQYPMTLYCTTPLNVRSGPGTNYSVLGSYSAGDEVTVTGNYTGSGWCQVSFNGQTGYVSAKYLASGFTVSGSSVAQAIGGITSMQLAAWDSYFYQLPSYITDAFKSSGWKIYVTDQAMGNYGGGLYPTAAGLTVYDEKTIYFSKTGICQSVVFHELGHWFDWKNGYIAYTSEFKEIYDKEYQTFKSTFNWSNVIENEPELWAEGFYEYLVNPTKLSQSCPELYAILNRYMG